jgi:signal transduction histidine kinase
MNDKPIRLLLIEDSPGDARLIREMLDEAGPSLFELVHLQRLSEGLQRLGEEAFDVLLLDLGLPDSQGLDTFFTVRSQMPEVPIVVLTDLGDETSAIKAVREGAQDYLVKGQVNSNLLVRSIRYALERHRLVKEKDNFLSTVSHELRSPLFSIRGFLELILNDKVPDAEKQRHFLALAYEEGKHLNSLVDDLLDISRMEAGQLQIEMETVSMHDVIHRVADCLQNIATEKSVDLQVIVPASLPTVQGDTGRLEQAVTNLVHNAIKFTPQGGEVAIRACVEDESLMVRVGDTGIGIPADALPNLFQRFYQVNGSATREAGGTGLGLYIAKKIIEGHEGRIWAESTLGRGSTFSFTIPISPRP